MLYYFSQDNSFNFQAMEEFQIQSQSFNIHYYYFSLLL